MRKLAKDFVRKASTARARPYGRAGDTVNAPFHLLWNRRGDGQVRTWYHK